MANRLRNERLRDDGMTSRSIILEEIAAVAKQQRKTLAPLTDDLKILMSGLDSLCFAVIVVRLEDRLGINPFTMSENVEFPETVGDFIAIYVNPRSSA
jgi:acyl carrier protein